VTPIFLLWNCDNQDATLKFLKFDMLYTEVSVLKIFFTIELLFKVNIESTQDNYDKRVFDQPLPPVLDSYL